MNYYFYYYYFSAHGILPISKVPLSRAEWSEVTASMSALRLASLCFIPNTSQTTNHTVDVYFEKRLTFPVRKSRLPHSNRSLDGRWVAALEISYIADTNKRDKNYSRNRYSNNDSVGTEYFHPLWAIFGIGKQLKDSWEQPRLLNSRHLGFLSLRNAHKIICLNEQYRRNLKILLTFFLRFASSLQVVETRLQDEFPIGHNVSCFFV